MLVIFAGRFTLSLIDITLADLLTQAASLPTCSLVSLYLLPSRTTTSFSYQQLSGNTVSLKFQSPYLILPRYVIFYSPFDVGYKFFKFLPIKVICAALKEIYRYIEYHN